MLSGWSSSLSVVDHENGKRALNVHKKNLKIPIIELNTCDCAYAGFRHTVRLAWIDQPVFQNPQIPPKWSSGWKDHWKWRWFALGGLIWKWILTKLWRLQVRGFSRHNTKLLVILFSFPTVFWPAVAENNGGKNQCVWSPEILTSYNTRKRQTSRNYTKVILLRTD